MSMGHDSSLNIYELIKSRRSIRAYKKDAVPREILDRILEAGLWAASGKNLQNWKFFVLTGEKRNQYLSYSQKSWLAVKDTLEKRLKPSLYRFTERFFFTLGDAPVVIFAFAETYAVGQKQSQVGNVYLAVENIVLAAQSEGLGTCIMGSPLEIEDDVRGLLGIEKNSQLKLVCGLTVGYPAHFPPAPPRQRDGKIVFL
jgi:nitroreductase